VSGSAVSATPASSRSACAQHNRTAAG
jgi:hypothetical protein